MSTAVCAGNLRGTRRSALQADTRVALCKDTSQLYKFKVLLEADVNINLFMRLTFSLSLGNLRNRIFLNI